MEENDGTREEGSRPEENPVDPVERLEGDVRQAQQAADAAHSEARKARAVADDNEGDIGKQRRSVRGLWASVVVLAFIFTAGIWMGFSQLRDQDSLIGQLPGVQTLVTQVDSRLVAAEAVLEEMSSENGVLRRMQDQISAFESDLGTAMAVVRQETQDLGADLARRIEAEMDRRVGDVETRMADVESSRSADRTRLARIQQEVDELRESTRLEVARLREQDAEIGRRTGRDLADVWDTVGDVRRRLEPTERELAAIARKVDKTRLGFELFEDDAVEIAPGIMLHVSDTNESRQKVSGWLHLKADGRILWVEDQPAQQSIVFYTRGEERSYELVFTHVTRDTAVGYALVPSDGSTRRTADRGGASARNVSPRQ